MSKRQELKKLFDPVSVTQFIIPLESQRIREP